MDEGGGTGQRGAIAVAGASGTIGRAVVRTLLEDGEAVIALVRSPAAAQIPELAGARIETTPIADPAALAARFRDAQVHTIISCLASRSGSPKDAMAVDYEANLALLRAALEAGAGHFILLSAICVQRPKLAFQRAKLAFEAALADAPVHHTIIRPTAFFKSLSGQIERVRKGKAFLLFGDGELTRCKPISDRDLARFIVDSVGNPERYGAVLPIGGPGPAISLREQGGILFEEAGREPRFRSVSPALFIAASRVLGLGAPFSAWFAEKAEYARIAHYYATESMLVLDPATGKYDADATPEFGEDTLRQHYRTMLDMA
jgi:divinyl chlorophyllide a 8-vinyl-reductase